MTHAGRVPARSRTGAPVEAAPRLGGAVARAVSGAAAGGGKTTAGGASGRTERSAVEGAAVYPMGVAERLSGLSQRQIRYYEAKGLIRPYRTPSGQRLFTAAHIRQLRRIRQLLQQGHNVYSLRVLLAGSARSR